MTDQPRWRARPWTGRAVRLAVHVVPVGVVTVAIWRIHEALGEPPDLTSALLRWCALSLGSTLALLGLDRIARRLLPLATLLRFSLVFPDEAPSRFAVAMRQNTTGRLRRDLEAGTLAPETPQEAAETLLTLVGELSRHDRLTRGHAERTRAYVALVADELGLSAEEHAKLQWSALLHDIGKLKVPAEVLTKSSALTSREWRVLRSHPDDGWAMVRPLRSWLGEWGRAVRDHHERWDGTGYPRGLEGTQISRAGRIVAVADAFDVMTSHRSYKAPVPIAEARAELVRCAGSHFDEEVVRAFINVGIGRLRLVMGPLSWLAQLPLLGRVQIGSVPAALATTAAAVSVVASSAILPAGGDTSPVAAFREVEVPPLQLPAEPGEGDTTVVAATRLSGSGDPSSTTPSSTTPSSTTPPPEATTRPPGSTSTSSSTTTTTTTTTTTSEAPPASTTTTTTTSTTTTTTTSPPAPLPVAYLGSFGEGPAVAVLPFDSGPTYAGVPNYDTDRNDDPGLTIKRSSAGLVELVDDPGTLLSTVDVETGTDESDDDPESQIWGFEAPPGGARLLGTPVMEVWAAARGFDPAASQTVAAALVVCDPSRTDCRMLSSGSAGFAQAGFGDDFGLVTVTMSDVDETVPEGDWIAMVITVPNGSDRDLWVAFDSVDYPSRVALR